MTLVNVLQMQLTLSDKQLTRKKVAVLFTVIGKTSYNILRDLCMPESPKDKKFNELCDLLQSHYKPKSLEVAGTFKFHQCKQQENESVSDYWPLTVILVHSLKDPYEINLLVEFIIEVPGRSF